MMQKTLLLLFLILRSLTYSQGLPTKPESGFSFPIGSKFTIKLHKKDTLNFDYSIIKFEPFKEVIDVWGNDKLFDEKGDEGTIEFYFCLGTSGKNEEEKQKNMKVLLLIKNRTEYALNYNSDIQIKQDGEFEKTSNVGTHPNVKSTEMWPYMIYKIGLNSFRKKMNKH